MLMTSTLGIHLHYWTGLNCCQDADCYLFLQGKFVRQLIDE
jgi:hypothetical protein